MSRAPDGLREVVRISLRLRSTGAGGKGPQARGRRVSRGDARHEMTDTDRELVDQVVEHRVVTAELRDRRSEAPTADEIAQWAAALPELLTVGSAQQRKALVPKLVKEIRVMGRDEIVPAYRISSLVRAPQGWVDPIGVEPTTSAMPWRRSTS